MYNDDNVALVLFTIQGVMVARHAQSSCFSTFCARDTLTDYIIKLHPSYIYLEVRIHLFLSWYHVCMCVCVSEPKITLCYLTGLCLA